MSARLTSFALIVSIACGAYAYDITVRWNEVHQKISGFGAGTGCPTCAGGGATSYDNAGMAIYGLPEPARTEILDLLFDSTKGVGFTCFRIGESWMLEDPDGSWHWARGPGEQQEIWVAKEAQKRNSNIKFWSAPWTPPLWMKTQQTMGGGELQTRYYQRYADYKSRMVREFRDKEGITMMANSVQNEPHFGSASYGGCGYSPEQIRTFVGDYLGPAFRRDGLDKTTTIMIAETNYPQPEWVVPTINDAAASAYVGILGWHQYPDGSSPPLLNVSGKESWATETSHGTWSGMGDVGWFGALWVHGQLYDAIVNKDANSWSYYLFGGWGNGGLAAISGTSFDPTCKRVWWVGHYSKFVRPGWVRIGTSVKTVGDGAQLSAFKDPMSGRFAIVVANSGYAAPGNSITVTCDGFAPRKVVAYLTTGDENPSMRGPTDVPIVNGKFTFLTPNVSIATLVGETQNPTSADGLSAAGAKPSIAAMWGPAGLSVRVGSLTSGRAELLDSQGRIVAQWKLAARAEQTLRFPRRPEAGVHFLRVKREGHGPVCQSMLFGK